MLKTQQQRETQQCGYYELLLAWRILEEKQKAGKKKQKNKKKVKVYFILEARHCCPHSVGVTCIDRGSRRRGRRRRGTKWNETKRESTLKLQYILLNFFVVVVAFCFISCTKRSLEEFRFCGFPQLFVLLPASSLLSSTWVRISRICILSVIGPTKKV